MEPRQQGLSGGHEAAPIGVGEHSFGANLESRDGSYERKTPEANTAPVESTQVVLPSLPMPIITSPDPVLASVSDDDLPSTAGDDDLIEKEWVDKAKKIIADTRDDPYRREKEISILQIEYIRKRYGREIGSSGDE